MKKKLSFIMLADIAVFAAASYFFYGLYLEWSRMVVMPLCSALCALTFAAAGAMAYYALKGAEKKSVLKSGIVFAGVYELLFWGIASVINRDGLNNLRAINTAYSVVLTLFVLLAVAFFLLAAKRSGKAVNITAAVLTLIVFVLSAVYPNSAFLKNAVKGDLDVYKSCYIFYDREYGDYERQVLDLFIPKEATHPEGVILFIHGGGWTAGDKGPYDDTLKSWARKGYIAAAMNYHYVTADVHMDVLMDDITAALAEIKTVAAEKGYDVKKCLLSGGSAGGHLSLLYAYMHGEDAPITPAAVVSYCGPADLTNRGYIFGNRLGDEERMSVLMSCVCGEIVDKNDLEKTKDALWKYSPAAYAENAVPSVLAHGECDSVVPFEDTAALDERLTELGIEHELVRYPHSDHDLAADPDAAARTEELFAIYAEKYL